MNIDRNWLWGGSGLVIGLLIGLAVAGDGREAREATLRGQKQVEESVASVQKEVGRISQSLTEIGGRVAGIEASVTDVTEQQKGNIDQLAKRLDTLGAGFDDTMRDVAGRVSALGGDVSTRLTQGLDGLGQRLAGFGGGKSSGGKAPTEGDAGTAAAATPGAGDLVAMGGAATLADGAVRVFLSATNPDAGSARVAINGPVASVVGLDQPVPAGECTVTLTGFDPRGATFTADCGGAGAGEATAGRAGSGSGTSVVVGSAATLIDEKLRVFLSAIDAGSGTARVAVNGPQTVRVSLGEPIEAGDCKLTLTGIGDGQATFDGSC
jgi:hypothetical protein